MLGYRLYTIFLVFSTIRATVRPPLRTRQRQSAQPESFNTLRQTSWRKLKKKLFLSLLLFLSPFCVRFACFTLAPPPLPLPSPPFLLLISPFVIRYAILNTPPFRNFTLYTRHESDRSGFMLCCWMHDRTKYDPRVHPNPSSLTFVSFRIFLFFFFEILLDTANQLYIRLHFSTRRRNRRNDRILFIRNIR